MNSIIQTTKPFEAKGNRWALGLGSKLVSLIFSVSVFIFFAFGTFVYTYTTHISGGGSQVHTEIYTAYEAFSVPYFSSYAPFFLILSMILSFVSIIFICIEIATFRDAHGPDLIILNLQILCLEFLLRSFSLGGILLFVFAVINYVQYFAFLTKHKEIDYWVFFSMIVLDLALLPSALVSYNLFLSH